MLHDAVFHQGLHCLLVQNQSSNLCQYIDIVLIFFHILVPQEYWVLMESRILLKPVQRGVRIVALSMSSHEQTP